MDITLKTALPRACVGACAAIAVASLGGWVSGVGQLTSVLPGLPQLVPMTAALILACGLGIWLQADPAYPARPAPAVVSGTIVGAASAAILLAHLVRRVPEPLSFAGDGQAAALSLSSPLTAAMFLASGVGLACIARPATVRHGQSLALGVLLLALLTMAGYVFRETFLYELLPGKGTSIMTTLSFMLLAVGMLALRPAEGIMVAVAGPDPGAWVARRLLLSALAMPVLLGAAAMLALHVQAIDVGTTIAFLVWGMIVLFTAVVWRFALVLYRIDVARRQAERQREEALRALREADAHKDDFMAMLAHELRNPLAPIRAAAELLRMRGGDEQARRAGDIVGRQVDNMVHLVDDLLDVARARRGLIALEKVPVDLLRAVHEAVEQARPQMAARGHRLDAGLPESSPMVLGDHKRLVQVFANLLGNAAKYTPQGGQVRLALRAGASEVEIEVSDDGIGIGPELLPNVFDTFTQGSRSAGRAEGGLGLGLALVKRLAELHGGTVAAHSAGPGCGSTFVVTLPRWQPDSGAEEAQAAPAAPAPARGHAGARP